MSALLDVLLADQRRVERRQMTAAQLAYDNQAEPDDDDELLTESQALTLAMEELETTPAVVAEWLRDETRGDDKPLIDDMHAIGLRVARFDDTLTPAQLIAVLVGGCTSDAGRALSMLRRHFQIAHGSVARERAEEKLAAQALAIQRARDESDDARAESAAYWRAA